MSTQHHVVTDPRPGQVVHLPAGSQLGVTFRRRSLGASAWHIAERPDHLLPLAAGSHEFQFLVFRESPAAAHREPTRLRLVRSNPDQPTPREVCDLIVVPDVV